MSRLEPLVKSVTKKIADLEVRGSCRTMGYSVAVSSVCKNLGSGKMVELGRLAVWCLVSIGTFRSSDATLKTTAPHFREDTVPVEKGQSLRGSATFNDSIVRCRPF